jgi:hypothetical protein
MEGGKEAETAAAAASLESIREICILIAASYSPPTRYCLYFHAALNN